MGRLSLSLVGLCVVLTGCDGEVRKRAKKLERHGDAPEVVYVEREIRGVSNLAPEIEPNDTSDAAMAIVPPAGARATLATEEDVDRYKITIADSGMLSIQVSGVEGIDLRVDVVQGDKVIFRSDRGGAGVSEGLPNLPVTKGKPIEVRVTEFISKRRRRLRKRKKDKARTEPSKPYELAAILVTEPRDDQETEPNSKSGGARELLLGERGRGYLGWNGDHDLWQVSLLGFAGGFSLDVDVQGVDGVAMTLEVLDDKGKVVTTRKGGTGQSLFVRGLEPGKGPEHYSIKLSGSRSNPTSEYVVRAMTRRFEPGDEIEPNDSAETASMVAEEGTARGQIRGHIGGGDRDVLKLPPPAEASVLNLSMEVPPSGDLAIAVKQGGRALAKADGGKAGVGEKLVGVPVDPGTPVVLVITGTFTGDSANGYRIDWDYALGDGFQEPPPGDGLE